MFIDLGNTTVNVHCNVSDHAFLEKVGAAYLPASAGFEQLECSHTGGDVFASPVLAWRIDGFGTGMPVCAEMNIGG